MQLRAAGAMARQGCKLRQCLAVNQGTVFRILVVDDNSTDVFVLRETLKTFARPCHVDWVKDGLEALDFLHRRGSHAGAQRPHLILLDLNMPRVDGLEALIGIKGDPELRVIPTLIFSSSTTSSEVRQSYQAYANGYLQKPTSLEGSERLVRALEAFWMDLVVLSSSDGDVKLLASKQQEAGCRFSENGGGAIATGSVEARSQAMGRNESAAAPAISVTGRAVCTENRRLLDEFGAAVHELLKIHEEQFRAIVYGDGDSSRFDLLIHMANERKQLAKYAYIGHVESHGCANYDAIDETRTRSD
jgi:two-component system, chemotaxis family, response regulator Rcp1